MSCAVCGHDNRAHARFCESCGRPLPSGPAAPTREPRAYTPRHLAERILTQRAAVQGERKPVTVLFADVQGSMALAEQVDAEEWHAIMNQFFAILSDGVHRYEGTVNQYTGDGIMALFGAPLAHEDHAQRACYTALHLTPALREYAQALRRERGLQFSVRMGLNSGEVVVGSIGDDLRMDYTAQGHTVGLASRMEQLCEAGRVYLTEHTAALVAGYFQLEDLGLFTIKGVRAPLRVFALLGAGPLRSRLDVARARGLSRFVGRAEELTALDAAVAEAAAGRSVAVALVGEAGVGKSRLSIEVCERARLRGAAVIETQALAHGAALPYLPVLTLFRRLLNIDERDPPETARQKIAGGLLLLDNAFKPSLPLLFDFLGVPDAPRAAPAIDAAHHADLLVEACAALVRARAGRGHALLLVEDLHWLDAASDAFLHRLLPALADTRLLILLNSRPGYDDAWLRDLGCQRIELRPLPAAAAGELLDELLGHDPSLGDLPQRLRVRAGGNPFFVEELVQSLAQSGVLAGGKGAYRLMRAVDDTAIPTSVQAVLAARIDRLDGRDKGILQTAAVIGEQFAEPVLRAVSGEAELETAAALRGLAAAGLIYEHSTYPVAEYAFRHPLTREVAYSTQLASRRAALHAAVAGALEQQGSEESAEHAALVAYHWEKAGAAWEAAQWQRRAARALMGTDSREALARLRRVLELLDEAPETDQALRLATETHDDLLRAANVTGMAREQGEALFAAGRKLAERTGDRSLQARMLSTFGEFLMTIGAGGEAQRYLSDANALASQIDDATVQLGVAMDIGQSAFWAGRVREALAHIDDVVRRLEAGVPIGSAIPVGLGGEAFAVALRGLCLCWVGRPREGVADLERVLAMSEAESASTESRCVAHMFRALAGLAIGERSAVLRYAQCSLELALRAANPFLERLARATQGSAFALSDRPREAIAMLQPLASGRADAGFGFIEPMLLGVLAEAYREAGEIETALRTAADAVAQARSNGMLTAECNAQLVLAAALAQTQGTAARAAVDAGLARAAELIDESGAASIWPRWHLARSQCLHVLEGAEAESRELREAERRARAMGMDELADRVARELAAVGGAEKG